MHASLRRLAAVCVTAAAAFGLAAAGGNGVGANETSCPGPSHPPVMEPVPHVAPTIVSQVLDQSATTDQDAHAGAVSAQVLPVNVNAPIQVLSLGTNGGDVDQRTTSVAASEAENTATTVQVAGQHQQVPDDTPATVLPPQGPAEEPSRPLQQPQHHDPAPAASQDLDQHARTDQDADAHSASVQVLPINVNAPIQVLSAGSNGGDTDQRSTSIAAADAENTATTVQVAGQSQHVDDDATPASSTVAPDTSASQDLDQHARTDQDADAHSASVQVLPINVNAPIQVLSVGHNGGDVDQANTSVGAAQAQNTATTIQGGLQHQLVPLG